MHLLLFQVTNEGDSSNMENDAMLGATLTESSTDKPNDTVIFAALEAITPEQITQSEQTSTKQVIFFNAE